MNNQPFTDCNRCGTADHTGYRCPCGCHIDFHLSDEGSIFLLTPLTAVAESWVAEHVSDDHQTFGRAIVVEHRYAVPIVEGLLVEGFRVQADVPAGIKWDGSKKNKIERLSVSVTTSKGNTLQFFYNPANDLVVVDLIDKNERGGNEILRKTLDETVLLGHLAKGRVA